MLGAVAAEGMVLAKKIGVRLKSEWAKLTIEESSHHNGCGDAYCRAIVRPEFAGFIRAAVQATAELIRTTFHSLCETWCDYSKRGQLMRRKRTEKRDTHLRRGGPPPGPAIVDNGSVEIVTGDLQEQALVSR